jgi:monofunctional biosynthetic peptidoglycan transglycosylase
VRTFRPRLARPSIRATLVWSVRLASLLFLYVGYVYLTVPDVRVLAARNPSTTAFIELRKREAAEAGRRLVVRQRWVPYQQISNNLRRAVLVAEDSSFFDHDGIDLTEIRASLERNWEEGRFVRGASTITQQLAKNLYLSPSRNPVRKLKELFITRRLEAALTKRRILEIYLNVIEWGDGIFGADAAARAYFGKSAAELTADEAALLAGAIINPRVHSPAKPSARLRRRQQIISRRMGIKPHETSAPPVASPPADGVRPDVPALVTPPGNESPPRPAESAPVPANREPDIAIPPARPRPPSRGAEQGDSEAGFSPFAEPR